MTEHIERTLANALDRRAATPVDTTGLAAAAVRRGRRLRRRRLALSGFGLVAVVGTATAGVTALTPDPGGRQSVGGPASQVSTAPPDSETPPPGGWKVPALPLATGVPGAAADPDRVGRVPGVAHFSIDTLVPGAESVTWAAGSGSESVTLSGADGPVEVSLARETARLDELLLRHNIDGIPWPEPVTEHVTVGGLPATLYIRSSENAEVRYLRWQPFSGVWAQVYAHGDVGSLTGLAARVRFDAAYQCVTPVRLGAVPPNAKLLGCSVTLSGADLPDIKGVPSRLAEAILTVGVGKDQATVTITRRLMEGGRSDITLAGHPARKTRNERGEWLIVIPDFDGLEVQLAGRGKYGYPELAAIGEGIGVNGDLRYPATWQTRAAR